MNQPHYIQLQILRKLLFSPSLRYSELRPHTSIENNQMSFHLDKLVEQSFVIKTKQGYQLTEIGKEYANQMDTDEVRMMKQGKISVIPCCVRQNEGVNQYLIYTRLKHPFFGFQGFPAGKINFGESVYVAVKRELSEETVLNGDPELFAITHYIVFNKKHELLEDKYFYFMKFMNPQGKLDANNEGKFEWVKQDSVEKYVTKPFDDFFLTLSELKAWNGNLLFRENEHVTDGF